MSTNASWAIAVIAVCAVVTFLERAFPFLIFYGREVPPIIRYLGAVLPMAIIATLVIYCLRGIDFSVPSSWAAQLISCVVTALLHLWKRSSLLSIGGGTICCMLLTQLVF